MTKYQLLKLVDWAGTLRTRKGMQKIVFLLQAAGCPLEVDYGLHHYGPYSSDLAQLTDQLVQLGLLEELKVSNPAGAQYNYRLTDAAKKGLREAEAGNAGSSAAAAMQTFEPGAKRLFATDVRELEVASTIAYFQQRTRDWDQALEKACHMKSLKQSDPLTVRAMSLAREVVAK